MAEYLDVVDADGEATGEIVERTYAHEHGIRHRTSNLWVVRRHSGITELLLQKRSEEKDSFPGYWYISAAGHVPAGESYEEAAVRELREEMGICVQPEELRQCGILKHDSVSEFYGKVFHDVQVSKIFYVEKDVEITELKLLAEEVSDACWMEIGACRSMVRDNTMKHCVGDAEIEALSGIF